MSLQNFTRCFMNGTGFTIYKTYEGTIQDIVGSGKLDIIKNEHLKNSIIDLYDVQLQSLIVDIDQAEWALNQSVILPFFSKNIRRLNNVSLKV